MAANLNTAILNSAHFDSAILHKTLTQTNSIWLKLIHLHSIDDVSHLEFCHLGFRHWHLGIRHLVIFSEIHSETLSLHSNSDSNYFNLINLMMVAILNLAILDTAILVFPLKLTHTCQDWFLLFAQKKNYTHSFSLNLIMTAILNSAMIDSDTAILDSDTLLSSLRFTQ